MKPLFTIAVLFQPYPWKDGVRSLFHNKFHNALPTGYEDEQ